MTETEYLRTLESSIAARIACRFDEAGELAARAMRAYPDESSGWHTMGMILSDLGLYAQALDARKRAVALLPNPLPEGAIQDAQQVHFALANSLLLAGEFEKAWPHWEIGRLGYSWTPAAGTTYWPGEDTDSLLVICEGGYGDLFNFSRWLPRLRKKVKGRIGLFVQPGLRACWGKRVLPYVDVCFELGEPYSTAVYKYSTGILSLPAQLGMKSIADIPVWRMAGSRAPKSERKRIGFCWRSEENRSPRRIRSLSYEEASAISIELSSTGHRVLSLSPAYKDMNPGGPVIECPCGAYGEPEQMTTWGDTAAYVRTMDLVLTVDTAVAHLAGIAGVPTLCLLPLNVDWKWGLPPDDPTVPEWTPWYGPEFRLFRNPTPKVWDMTGIVVQVKRILESK